MSQELKLTCILKPSGGLRRKKISQELKLTCILKPFGDLKEIFSIS